MVVYCFKNFWNELCNLFTLLWIISEFDLIYTSEVREMIWNQDETYKDLTLSVDFVWQKTVRSRLKCSVECTDDERCGAFFFSDADKSCLASPFLLESTGQGIAVVGTEYYFFRPANCPDEYTYNRKTDLCVKIHTDTLQWNDAKSACEAIANGGLVTIQNQNQYDFIVQELDKISLNEYVYIDGTDEVVEGTFIGKDGKEITFFDWDPTTQMDNMHESQDCLSLNPDNHYKYVDTEVGIALRYICEVV
ncbi:alpha-N-acetylgalactosamine-specific lectin-like [Mytilus californianus]|uniref:alpha-N-acetylgalactosamine-specific lectin-like n=1 Tax=Mytilus californianus TaxID=6549 RepID=UPI002246A7DD|nr:alpha-N-acetylgalactosamine-specific lectin-like [Mytilus californianus]